MNQENLHLSGQTAGDSMPAWENDQHKTDTMVGTAPFSHPAFASPASGWKLVWSDEFDVDGAPDPTKWSYEEGFLRNKESQYYTGAHHDNVRVENSLLIIECRKERVRNARYDPNSMDWRFRQEYAEYSSANLVTEGKVSWHYGRIEVRAKFPQGAGVWPAVWALGDDHRMNGWPACGEIDIIEFVGNDAGHIHGTAHYRHEGIHTSCGGKLKVEEPHDGFHVYATEWNEDRLDFFMDGQKYHSFDLDGAVEHGRNPFHRSHFLLVNLALGGGWGGKVDDTILPQSFVVDYIRIYQRQNAPGN